MVVSNNIKLSMVLEFFTIFDAAQLTIYSEKGVNRMFFLFGKSKNDSKRRRNVKISIAIPVYNAGKHIHAALDSLKNQTMKKSDFEVICVNDKSTDNSEAVIKRYQETMGNLILINREENSGGPMIPRNDAIRAARGKYLMFLDNDDFIGEETLERFYKAAEENHSDVIFGKYVGVNGRGVPQSQFKRGNRPQAEILEDNLVFTLAPHKMFRLDFLRENGFEFHPKAVVGEDQLFVMQCYIRANVITVLADYDYYYVVSRGDENLSLKYFPAEEFFFSFNRIMEFIEESELDLIYKNKVKMAFLNRFLHSSRLRSYLLSPRRLTESQKREWLNAAKEFFGTHLTDEELLKIKPHFRYFVEICKENNLEKLLDVHQKMENLHADDITRVEDGLIYARFRRADEQLAYDEEYIANGKNVSHVFLKDFTFGRTSSFSVDFQLPLLVHFPVQYRLVFIHRKTGIEVSDDYQSHTDFMFDMEKLLIDRHLGPWDLFIEGEIKGFTHRRRLGASRAGHIREKQPIEALSHGRHYSIRPYYTQKYDNLSFDVKPLKVKERAAGYSGKER